MTGLLHCTDYRHRQRGAATLLMTMGLLLGMSITLLYLNRNLVIEQKAAANQIRATLALEMLIHHAKVHEEMRAQHVNLDVGTHHVERGRQAHQLQHGIDQ